MLPSRRVSKTVDNLFRKMPNSAETFETHSEPLCILAVK